MAKRKTNKVAKEIGAGILAAGATAAAGYYLYGSKNAKKNRKIVAKELKADWKIMQREAQKTGKKVVKKTVKKIAKKAGVKIRTRKSR